MAFVIQHLPFIKGKPASGYFGTDVPNTSVTGFNMYYNGDFVAARVFNTVYQDYAEYFNVISNEEFKSPIIYNDVVVGLLSNNYGRCLGNDGTPVVLIGRSIIETDTKFNAGDMVYWDGEFKIAKDYTEYSINPVGKILYQVKECIYMVLVH